jgi:hypothetical protein
MSTSQILQVDVRPKQIRITSGDKVALDRAQGEVTWINLLRDYSATLNEQIQISRSSKAITLKPRFGTKGILWHAVYISFLDNLEVWKADFTTERVRSCVQSVSSRVHTNREHHSYRTAER